MAWARLAALACVLVAVATPVRAAEPAEARTGEADADEHADLLPGGVIFHPPRPEEMDFNGDLPEARPEVEKDTRVVAVIFSVNQVDSMRDAFPNVENVDLMPVAGRPMIAHVIDGVKTSRYVDRVIVVADPEVEEALGAAYGSSVTFLTDQGDAAENVKHGIREIARGDLVLLMPSDLPLVSGAGLDQLVEHAREYDDIDVFFPLIQKERCTDALTQNHRFIPFKEGKFTGAHVELVRPALFVDNADEVQGEKDRMYSVYNMRRDTLGIIRFLGVKLTVKYLLRELSPTDVATRLYSKYHVRAQAFVATDTRLAADLREPELVPHVEAYLRAAARAEPDPPESPAIAAAEST